MVTFVAAVVPPINIPRHNPGDAPYPAPPGYVLPWAGGEIQAITQGEETSFTHNGLAAYAFDIGLRYDTVVAARSGRVQMVYEASNNGGCDARFSAATNYVVIDHGDGTSALYMHLAYDSVQVEVGQEVWQGDPIAISGETGLTCGGGDTNDQNPGPHLHFQVQSFSDTSYFTQSQPVAFDDVKEPDGVPREGQSYVSGNYGRGESQKIKLTPRRVPRIFNPVATPADPTVRDGPIETSPPPPDAASSPEAVVPNAEPTAPPEDTPTPGRTATPEPTDTPGPDEPPPPDDPPPPPPPTATSTPAPPEPSPTPQPSATAPPPTVDPEVYAQETATPSPTATATAPPAEPPEAPAAPP